MSFGFRGGQVHVSTASTTTASSTFRQRMMYNQFLSSDLTPEYFQLEIQEPHLLEQLIRLYTAYMANDVRSPVPHLAGPPGVGKSESVEKLAELVGKQLHVINVSRISPLEIEGVQMPQGTGNDLRLKLLHNPLWTNLKEGDIVLLDEFLRGFPEVYNGLLDILTSRQVAGFTLPKVFFVAASNSVTAYDAALEDRLLHLFVPDIRRKGSNNRARTKVKEILVEELCLIPEILRSSELEELIKEEIEPMYEILDMFKHKKRIGSTALKGHSVRNLLGQARLRQVESAHLRSLIALNNRLVEAQQKYQYFLYLDGPVSERVMRGLKALVGHAKLTENQAANLNLNLMLIEMYAEATIKIDNDTEEDVEDDIVV